MIIKTNGKYKECGGVGREKERTKYREKQNVRIKKISKQMGKIESVQGS